MVGFEYSYFTGLLNDLAKKDKFKVSGSHKNKETGVE